MIPLGRATNREQRAASALLAVIHAVPGFGHALLAEFGDKRPGTGPIDTFIEPAFETPEGRTRPDGSLIVRANPPWKALIEVKVDNNRLTSEQLLRYIGLARVRDYQGLLSVSNHESGPTLPRIKTRSVAHQHVSWLRVRGAAVSTSKSLKNPDQCYILDELVRYISEEASGAAHLQTMGGKWPAVLRAMRSNADPDKDSLAQVARQWDDLVRGLCARFSMEWGVEVRPADPSPTDLRLLKTTRALTAELRVSTVVPVTLHVDLAGSEAALHVEISTTLTAPAKGQTWRGQVSTLMKELRPVPTRTMISSKGRYQREWNPAVPVDKVPLNRSSLCPPKGKVIRLFKLSRTQEVSTKANEFPEAIRRLVHRFHRDVLVLVLDYGRSPTRSRPKRIPDSAEGETRPPGQPPATDGNPSVASPAPQDGISGPALGQRKGSGRRSLGDLTTADNVRLVIEP